MGLEPVDTSLASHHVKEVIVLRTKHYGFVINDTIPVYQMYFYKMYENKLRRYDMADNINRDYDKASYRWEGDAIVYITLFNSKTSKKGKTWKLSLAEKDARAFVDKYEDPK